MVSHVDFDQARVIIELGAGDGLWVGAYEAVGGTVGASLGEVGAADGVWVGAMDSVPPGLRETEGAAVGDMENVVPVAGEPEGTCETGGQ